MCYTNNKNKVHINEQEAEIVRLIFDKYVYETNY